MKPTGKQEKMAAFFIALAHPRRQMIFQILKDSGNNGMPFHRLLHRTGLTPPTLAFHLGKMREGQIINRKIKGPETWLTRNLSPFAAYDALA